VAKALEEAYAEEHRELASFSQGDSVELQEKLHDLLAMPAEERRQLGAAARRVAIERWSWESVAQRLLEPFQ
jgi:glycosyltransferase involved in cell wall biosynthesis